MKFFLTKTSFVAIVAFLGSAQAHMRMRLPSNAYAAGVSSSPIGPPQEAKQPFPCNNIMGPEFSIGIGEKGKLGYIGGATHGGGSCQVSLTKDNPPTPKSVWKVIKSFHGSCVSHFITGNEDDNNPTAQTPLVNEWSVPDVVPPGKYTFSWTWFNRIGNREMYQNCAPVEITGKGGDEKKFNALPDMFVANIGVNDCQTPNGVALIFPDPGNVVEKYNEGEFGEMTDTSKCLFYKGGKGKSSGGEGEKLPADKGEKSPKDDKKPKKGGTFKEDPSEDGNSSSKGSCKIGTFECLDGTKFRQCDNGFWAQPRDLAEGTACEPGISDHLVLVHKSSRRTVRVGAKMLV